MLDGQFWKYCGWLRRRGREDDFIVDGCDPRFAVKPRYSRASLVQGRGPSRRKVGKVIEELQERAGGEGRECSAQGAVTGMEEGEFCWVGGVEPAAVGEEPVASGPMRTGN